MISYMVIRHWLQQRQASRGGRMQASLSAVPPCMAAAARAVQHAGMLACWLQFLTWPGRLCGHCMLWKVWCLQASCQLQSYSLTLAGMCHRAGCVCAAAAAEVARACWGLAVLEGCVVVLQVAQTPVLSRATCSCSACHTMLHCHWPGRQPVLAAWQCIFHQHQQ